MHSDLFRRRKNNNSNENVQVFIFQIEVFNILIDWKIDRDSAGALLIGDESDLRRCVRSFVLDLDFM